MKLKKKAPKATTAETAATPVAAEITINGENFDAGIMYLGENVATSKIRKAALGLVIPKLSHSGFLVIEGSKKGDKATAAIHPVKWDGKDRYSRIRTKDKTLAFGSIKAINENAEDKIKVRILDLDGLKALAKKTGLAIEAQRRSDDRVFKVLLISQRTGPCYAGVVIEKGKLTTLNMEEPHPNNEKVVQFAVLKDLNVKPLLKELAAAA